VYNKTFVVLRPCWSITD